MSTLKTVGLKAEDDRVFPRFDRMSIADARHFIGNDYVDVRALMRSETDKVPDVREMMALMSAVGDVSRFMLSVSLGHEATSMSEALARGMRVYVTQSRRWKRPRLLFGADATANLDTWMRTSELGDVLIEVNVPTRCQRGPSVVDLDAFREFLLQLVQTAALLSPIAAPDDVALPPEIQAKVDARQDAIDDWLTAHEAGRRLPGTSKAPDQRTSRLRREGRLLAVWVPEERAYRYAPWQFDAVGNPHPRMAEILALLRGPTGVSAGRPTSGWEELEWFLAPHAASDGVPAEQFEHDPDGVFALAYDLFAPERAHAGW